MQAIQEEMRDLAIRLAREAGRYAVAELENHLGIAAKGNGADVVTRVDHECERRIVAGIQELFPDHAIIGEESGHHGEADAGIRWFVDPLDGTNNYVMGSGSASLLATGMSLLSPLFTIACGMSRPQQFVAAARTGATGA